MTDQRAIDTAEFYAQVAVELREVEDDERQERIDNAPCCANPEVARRTNCGCWRQ